MDDQTISLSIYLSIEYPSISVTVLHCAIGICWTTPAPYITNTMKHMKYSTYMFYKMQQSSNIYRNKSLLCFETLPNPNLMFQYLTPGKSLKSRKNGKQYPYSSHEWHIIAHKGNFFYEELFIRRTKKKSLLEPNDTTDCYHSFRIFISEHWISTGFQTFHRIFSNTISR